MTKRIPIELASATATDPSFDFSSSGRFRFGGQRDFTVLVFTVFFFQIFSKPRVYIIQAREPTSFRRQYAHATGVPFQLFKTQL